jgi:7-keto-8-aminopelargonate synthetase-like enzyme
MHRPRLRALAIAALPLFSFATCLPAAAQMQSREAISLQDQILELRHELETLQAQQGGTAAPAPYYPQPTPTVPSAGTSDTVAQLLTRVSTLEDQISSIFSRWNGSGQSKCSLA